MEPACSKDRLRGVVLSFLFNWQLFGKAAYRPGLSPPACIRAAARFKEAGAPDSFYPFCFGAARTGKKDQIFAKHPRGSSLIQTPRTPTAVLRSRVKRGEGEKCYIVYIVPLL